jgi:hypothetical protein
MPLVQQLSAEMSDVSEEQVGFSAAPSSLDDG